MAYIVEDGSFQQKDLISNLANEDMWQVAAGKNYVKVPREHRPQIFFAMILALWVRAK